MNTELCSRFPEEFKAFKSLYKNMPWPAIDFKTIGEQIIGHAGMPNLVKNVRDSFISYVEVLLTLENLQKKATTMEQRLFAEEMARVDEWRRHSHDAMIANVNILVRNMRKRNLDVSWFKISSPENRTAYAMLAMKTAFNELCTCQ